MRRRLSIVLSTVVALVAFGAVAASGHSAVPEGQIDRGLRTPPGFDNAPWAAVPAPTSIEWGPDGALYATSMDGGLYRVAPAPGGGAPAAQVTSGFSQPLGIAIAPDGRLFVADSYAGDDGLTYGRVTTVLPDGSAKETVISGLPNGRHNTNDMTIGPDGLLYITNGNSTDNGVECGPAVVPGQDVSCAVGERQPWSGSLLRIDPSLRDQPKQGAEIVATGMRNPYDVAFRPGTTEAWVPTNGPDNPAADDVLYRIETAAAAEPVPTKPNGKPIKPKKGDGAPAESAPLHLGFPSCLYNAHENAGLGTVDDHHDHGHSLEPMNNPRDAVIAQFGPCPVETVQRPVATFGGHVSADGLAFAHGSAFPGTYGNDLFVAEWGNLWGAEDGHVSGHKVVRVNLRDDGTVVHPDDDHPDDGGQDEGGHAHSAATAESGGDGDHHAVSAITEFATAGLPIDIAFGPDGAMYVADMAGLIHRIAWNGSAVPPDDEHGAMHHDHGAHEYQPVSCPGDVGDTHVFEHREHHANGRTECVIVDGDPVYFCGDANGDCYVAYDPYQQDMVDGDSPHDRGPAVRYHNNDVGAAGGHHHGTAGCWATDPATTLTAAQQNTAGKAAIQTALGAVVEKYTGPNGFDAAMTDGWYFYPVPESKQLHMVRQFWAGDMNPDDSRGTRLNENNLESFVLAMTDSGWQVMNAMFTLGNEGDEAPVYDSAGRVQNGPVDYKLIDDEAALPAWVSADGQWACDLPWHGHTGEEGVATSFDPEHPDISDWMAHIGLYAAEGDPFAENRGYDGSEPHAYFEPWRHVPALCNPVGPCE